VYNQVRIEGEKEVIAQRPVAIVPAMKISGLFYEIFGSLKKLALFSILLQPFLLSLFNMSQAYLEPLEF